MRRLGVYGGSFDPPHFGHVRAVTFLLETGRLDRVIVVPVYAHAFQKDTTPFAERLELCRLAFSGLGGRVEVSDLESRLSAPSYTIDTLEELARIHPESELHLIVGSDLLEGLSRWHRSAEIQDVARLLVLGRAGYEHPGVISAELPEISSTEVRSWLREGGDDSARARLAEAVPQPVLAEIVAKRLYRS